MAGQKAVTTKQVVSLLADQILALQRARSEDRDTIEGLHSRLNNLEDMLKRLERWVKTH